MVFRHVWPPSYSQSYLKIVSQRSNRLCYSLSYSVSLAHRFSPTGLHFTNEKGKDWQRSKSTCTKSVYHQTWFWSGFAYNRLFSSPSFFFFFFFSYSRGMGSEITLESYFRRSTMCYNEYCSSGVSCFHLTGKKSELSNIAIRRALSSSVTRTREFLGNSTCAKRGCFSRRWGIKSRDESASIYAQHCLYFSLILEMKDSLQNNVQDCKYHRLS